MDIKCSCGKFARINMGIEWLCWDCRANDLRKTHGEDWRDFELRAMAKKLKLGLKQGESMQELGARSRVLFKELVNNLDMVNENNRTKHSAQT